MLFARRWICGLLLAFTFCALVGRAAVNGVIVYDNSINVTTNYAPSPYEVGDEIFLSKTNSERIVTSFSFEYYGDFIAPTNGSATARLRFYAMDGPIHGGFHDPGTVLYDSGPNQIFPGYKTLTVTGIAVQVPSDMTWSVEFGGTLTNTLIGNRAGLLVYSPPDIGTSFNDFWIRKNGVWQPPIQLADTHTGALIDTSFAARMYAVQQYPVVITGPLQLADGTSQLNISGPPGRTLMLSATSDLKLWTPIARLQLVTNSVDYVDQNAAQFPIRYYRAALISDTAITVKKLAVLPNGQASLEAAGPAGFNFSIQGTTDFRVWTPVYTNTFTAVPTAFVDTNSAGIDHRFYRTVLLPGP